MTLGFKQHFPWKLNGEPEPTNFREKILAGTGYIPEDVRNMPKNGQGVLHLIEHPKIHTFREDPHNRWKAGRKIEMVYRGAGYKIIAHFNKGIPELEKCVSVQKIEIIWRKPEPLPWPRYIKIDNRSLDVSEVEKLALNDGFVNADAMFKWFPKDFTGKIIHWTDLRY